MRLLHVSRDRVHAERSDRTVTTNDPLQGSRGDETDHEDRRLHADPQRECGQGASQQCLCVVPCGPNARRHMPTMQTIRSPIKAWWSDCPP